MPGPAVQPHSDSAMLPFWSFRGCCTVHPHTQARGNTSGYSGRATGIQHSHSPDTEARRAETLRCKLSTFPQKHPTLKSTVGRPNQQTIYTVFYHHHIQIFHPGCWVLHEGWRIIVPPHGKRRSGPWLETVKTLVLKNRRITFTVRICIKVFRLSRSFFTPFQLSSTPSATEVKQLINLSEATDTRGMERLHRCTV